MEDRFEIATPLGDVWMWGRDTGKPILLVVTGAFAEFGVYDRLQLVLPGFDVLRTHLPGNHSPPLIDTSVGVMGRALGLAMDARFADRPFVAIGVSTGAVAAMAMTSPGLKALLLIEPFLRTAHIWPFGDMLEPHPEPWQREFLWKVLGVREGERAERDYSGLVASLRVPGLVLLGAEPLEPPRRLAMLPSFVGEADRAVLRAQPLLRVTEAPGTGHNVAAQSVAIFIDLLVRLCRAIAPDTVID